MTVWTYLHKTEAEAHNMCWRRGRTGKMAYKYTQADVEAMSDAELSRLASRCDSGEIWDWVESGDRPCRSGRNCCSSRRTRWDGLYVHFYRPLRRMCRLSSESCHLTWNKIIAVKAQRALKPSPLSVRCWHWKDGCMHKLNYDAESWIQDQIAFLQKGTRKPEEV